jgi:tetratricopeptide (TPR) repeat protein
MPEGLRHVTGWVRPRRRVAATVSLLTGTLYAAASAQEVPCEFPAVPRIVAIGDVHGAYDRFVEVLTATGLIDQNLEWIGGTTHLVQTGDVVDRGPDSRKVMDLLMALEPEAEAAGGRVHALLGNHEFWVAVGMFGYVSKAEFAAFAGRRDEVLRADQGATDAVPRGALALREAYGASGEYGRWLRSKNAAVKIGDVVFVHGGITPELAPLGLRELNRRIRADLDSESWAQSFALRDDGPLMTRRYSSDDLLPHETEALASDLAKSLEILDARLVVMAHTVTYGLIEPRFDGRAILIDTGMLELYLGGRAAALVLEGDDRFAVYSAGRVTLPNRLDGEEGHRYVEAVVRASPGDRGLDHWLALVRTREGRFSEAAELHRALGVLDPEIRIPYAWRRDAADCFAALGKNAEAEEAETLYLRELSATAEGMGSAGTTLMERYARECLRLGRVNLGFEAARELTSRAPENLAYKEILARAYLETGDPQRAVRVLLGAKRLGGDGFELQLLLGRAQLELGRTAEALEAFEAAERFRPGDPNVAEALDRLKGGAK